MVRKVRSDRRWKTIEEKIALKAAYDRDYRKKNAVRIKADHAAYFQRTYDPVKAAIERKKKMPVHVEYCRQPIYRAYKQGYMTDNAVLQSTVHSLRLTTYYCFCGLKSDGKCRTDSSGINRLVLTSGIH